MISFANFTTQENPNGDFPNLLSDETLSTDFDAFLNLFIVVPETNSMFSEAEIPQELNENPIGLQLIENLESEIPVTPLAFSESVDTAIEKDTSALNEIPQSFLIPEPANANPVTESLPAELQSSSPESIDLSNPLIFEHEVKPQTPDNQVTQTQSQPHSDGTPIPDLSSPSEHSPVPQKPVIDVDPQVLLDPKSDSLPDPKVESANEVKSKPLLNQAIPIPLEDSAPQQSNSNLKAKPIASLATEVESSEDGINLTTKQDAPNPSRSVDLKPNASPSTEVKPNPSPSTDIKPNPSPSTDIKPNPFPSTEVKPNPNQPENILNKPNRRIHNPAAEPSTAEELGFKVLSIDQKPRGLGRLQTDVQNYSGLNLEKPPTEKRPAVLPKVSEIVQEAKVIANENTQSRRGSDVSINPLLQPGDTEDGAIPLNASKPLIKSIAENLDTGLPKKPASPIQTDLDFGAFTKDVSAQKFQTNLAPKTIANVQAIDVAKQIETPLLDLASLETDSDEPNLLKFRLKPAELGSVEIRLEKNLAGKLEVHFRAENEMAKQILGESFEHLRASLQNAGWQVEQMEASSGSLSPNGFDSREEQSRKNESTKLNNSAIADENLESEEDLPKEDPNRLVSLRA